MTRTLRSIGLIASCLIWSAGAAAQSTPATSSQQPSSASTDSATRPATNTFFGDTGIWFVPTAEILPDKKWSVSGYRRGTNFVQGYSNVGDFAGTFGVGIKNRAEIFGSLIVDTRIDRDLRPLFGPATATDFGGIIDRYPRVNQYWTGDHIGDFYLGAKFNILSEYRQQGVAVAARAMVQLPTGDDDTLGSGTDWTFDLIASKETKRFVEVSGYLGWGFYSSAEGFNAPNGEFRYGAGAAFPSRSPLRVSGELTGRAPVDNNVEIQNPPLVGIDGSIAPIFSNVENLTRWTVGLTYQAKNGFFVGGGLSATTPTQDRLAGRTVADDTDPTGDFWDWQVRIGYHPGVRIYVPPPPPPPPPPPLPPPPAPAPQHNLTVTATCTPNMVAPGGTSNCTATPQSSINCAVTYRWAAPSGTLATPAERQTGWTAGNQEGTVPVTITVTCPTDNRTATATVNVQVVRPPQRTYTFEDVYFDFDRYSLRPEATRVLDEAVTAMNQDATLRITIEGHTCNIGTAEYNLALGERRAVAVRQYLQSRGIGADRMTTISYGEERPKYDNAREETRRLNRRAAMIVRLQ